MSQDVQDPPKIRVTAIKYRNTVGKGFTMDGDKLHKLPPGKRTDRATAVVREFDTPQDYFKWAETLDAHHMQVTGTFPMECDGETVRNSEVAQPGEISATKEWLKFREMPGVVRIDADFKTADEVHALYPEEPFRVSSVEHLRDILIEAAPSLKSVAMRVKPSSSSYIHVDGKQVSGARGFHAEFVVDNASAIPRLLTMLHRKFWRAGYGWAFVSNGGAILDRSPVDMALDRPMQPIFQGGNILDDRITSGAKTTLYEGGMGCCETLFAELAPATAIVDRETDAALDVAVAALSDKRDEVRKAKAEELAPAYAKRRSISIDQAEKEIIAAHSSPLPLDFPLQTAKSEELVARDLYDAKWNGVKLKPPLEPGYQASAYVRYNQDGMPYIIDLSHGVQTNHGIQPLVTPLSDEVAIGIKMVRKAVSRVIQSGKPEHVINEAKLAAELARVFRDAGKTGLMYRIQETHGAGFRVNAYSKSEFIQDIFKAEDYILKDNLPKDSWRGGNFSRWMSEQRLTAQEHKQISKALATVDAQVARALRRAVSEFIMTHRQVDNLNYRVDMFEDTGKIEIERTGALVAATLVQPHQAFDVTPYSHVGRDEYLGYVRDFLEHFPQFDELIKLIAAARFASDGREAFFWMRATSSFGKNFLTDGIFGKGTDRRGLGVVMSVNMKTVASAMEGKPSPINPDEYSGAWVLFCDEFKAASGSLKELNNTLRVSPKNRMQGEMRLYLKWFTSDEDAPSMSLGGVDRQLANRFSYWDVDGGKLTARPLYRNNRSAYLDSLRKYAALRLNALVEEYQSHGPPKSSDLADERLSSFHSKYNITKAFGSLDDEIKEIAQEFREEITRIAKLSEDALNVPRDVAAVRADTLYGKAIVGEDAMWVGLMHPENHLEAYLKKTRGSSELVKVLNRKTEIIQEAGLRSDRTLPHRIYLCEPSGAFVLEDYKRVKRLFRGLLMVAT